MCEHPARKISLKTEAGYHYLEFKCEDEEGCDFSGCVARIKLGWRDRWFFTQTGLDLEEVAAIALDTGLAIARTEKKRKANKRERKIELKTDERLEESWTPATLSQSLASSVSPSISEGENGTKKRLLF